MSLIDPITHKARTLAPADISPTSVFEVWLERLDKSLGEDFGWEKIAEATASRPGPARKKKAPFKMASNKALAGELVKKRKFDVLMQQKLVESVFALQPLYDGEIILPAMQGERYRLVIAEYEEYLTDDSRPYDRTPETKDKRLVFVEHVELD